MAQAESTVRVDVGTTIADTYEIKRLLGRGGMGTVWEASHARLPGKKVAIKVLHPEVAKDQESLARFRREAEIASRIGHPNIVDVHDFNQLADGTPYLILEYLEGLALEDRLHQGPMSLEETIALVRQVGSALRAAHAEDVVHRDLKPANIFLARSTDASGNEVAKARVLDFGISKIRGSATVQTQDSTILGTPQYMAPEQATGNHSSVDQRTDVFALGAIVYEMLSGRPAFDGQTIPEVVFKVVYEEPTPLDQVCAAPPGIARAVHQALAKKQEERFPTVEAFIEALSGTALSVRGAPIPTGVQPKVEDVGLASTVASGNHPNPLAATGAQSSAALGTAATIDSGRLESHSLGLPPQPTGRGPVAESAVAHGHPPARPEKSGAGGLKIALVLALLVGIGGAGAAFWALTRDNNQTAANTSETSEPVAVASKADAATIAVEADAGAMKSVEPPVGETAKEKAAREKREKAAAKEKAAAEKAAKAAEKAKAEKAAREKAAREKAARDKAAGLTPNTGTGTDEPPESAGADSPKKDYQEARSLLHSNPRRTIKLVQRALSNGARAPRFYVLKAKAHCKLRDLTRLNATKAKLSPRRKAEVLRFCKRVWPGFDD